MGRARRAALVVTAMAVGFAVVGPAFARPATSDTAWGPVVTVVDQSFESLSTVTTDNGMAVAVWSGRSFNDLFIAVRRGGDPWSPPTKIATVAAGLTLAKDHNGAWVLWQGFDSVSALRIARDGDLGTPETIGPSADPFVSDARIAAGAHGAVAAVWHTTPGSPTQLAYRPAGGDWTPAEEVPATGGVAGLVVGGAGYAQIVVQKNNPDFRHQEVSYLRRSPTGEWSSPFVVASKANLTIVTGNRHGDLALGWEVIAADDTISLVARYKAAEGPFGAARQLSDNVPYNSRVALAMAADGSLASAYRTSSTGGQQIQVTRADSTGSWLASQDLALTGSVYAVAMNAAGDFAVTSLDGKGVQLSRCPAGGVCGSAETHLATAYRFPSTTLAPNGALNLVWGRGCKTEECVPTSLVAQRGR